MSKKRSASKTDAQPDLVFFVDRSLGARKVVVLTKDSLRERPNEMRAIASARVRTFILVRRHLHGDDMAQVLVAHLSGMVRMCRREQAPFVATIGGGGLKLIKRSGDLH